jgi:hypothetical protein
MGNPSSQVAELFMGNDMSIPEAVKRLNPNIAGVTYFLFTAANPANNPNAKVTTAKIPINRK